MTARGRRRFAALLLGALCLAPALADARGGQIVIAGLDGLDLGRWPGRGDLAAVDRHCVAVTWPGPPRFHLEAFGDGPGGAFVLADGAVRLPFAAYYDDGTGVRRLRAGRVLAHLRAQRAPPRRGPCFRGVLGERHRIAVRVRERDLARAGAGRFRGRITLMVVPE